MSASTWPTDVALSTKWVTKVDREDQDDPEGQGLIRLYPSIQYVHLLHPWVAVKGDWWEALGKEPSCSLPTAGREAWWACLGRDVERPAWAGRTSPYNIIVWYSLLLDNCVERGHGGARSAPSASSSEEREPLRREEFMSCDHRVSMGASILWNSGVHMTVVSDVASEDRRSWEDMVATNTENRRRGWCCIYGIFLFTMMIFFIF